jgi:hypothetical protein
MLFLRGGVNGTGISLCEVILRPRVCKHGSLATNQLKDHARVRSRDQMT